MMKFLKNCLPAAFYAAVITGMCCFPAEIRGAEPAVAPHAVVGAKVELAPVFSDNAVLQRDREIPVWGWASPGENVTVKFAGQTLTATAGKDGKWLVKLAPLAASKVNRTLEVSGSTSTVRVKNILVGEVWIASGQSNMEMPLWGARERYRHRNANGTGKQVADRTNLPFFRFTRMPRQWSTTRSEKEPVMWHSAVSGPELEAGSAVAFFFGRELVKELDVPVGIIGAYWGGTRIEPWTPPVGFDSVPELADIARTVNAKLPGTSDYQKVSAKVMADYASWLEKYKAAIANGQLPPAPPVFPMEQQSFSNQQQPTVLFNKMLATYVPYAVRGAIWYQGEANLEDKMLYRYKMQALLNGWRKEFQNPEMSFYFVQLAPHAYRKDETTLPQLWEAQQTFADANKKVGMVVVTDSVHTVRDIHPADKEVVGKRLARLALKHDYGRSDVKADSPRLKESKIEGNAFILDFNFVESWQNAEGAIPYFEVAGIDGTFLPARAAAEGTRIRVSSDQVPEPKSVRYMWKQTCEGKLANEAGLVLGSFRIQNVPSFAELFARCEANGRLVYEYDLKSGSNFGDRTQVRYKVDNSEAVKGNFGRITYLIRLDEPNGNMQFVCVSMDPFTQNVKQIGVPVKSTGAVFQTRVRNLNVLSNVDSLATGNISEGNIEFWSNGYGARNAVGIPGASDSAFDFGDERGHADPGYGSMQIHNPAAKQTIFAYNHFEAGANADLGIGNQPSGNPDWTFSKSARRYKQATLYVFVNEHPRRTEGEPEKGTSHITSDASENITAVGKPWSLSFELAVDSYPDCGRGFFNQESPMTLVVLDDGEGSRLLLRLLEKHLHLEAPATRRKCAAAAVVEPGSSCRVQLESDGKELKLRANGHLVGILHPGVACGNYRTVRIGSMADGSRKLRGKIEKFELRPGVPPPPEPGKKLPLRSPRDEGYPALRCAEHVLHPWIDQLHISAAAVPWFSPAGRDLLVNGAGFAYGSRLAVYRFLGISPAGAPVYDSGTTLNNLPGNRFQCRRRRDGNFDLFAAGTASIYGNDALIFLENKGKPGSPDFCDPVEVLAGGKRISQAIDGRWSGFTFSDLDGDGVEDLLIAKCYSPPGNWTWPLGAEPWRAKETRFLGRGKGYDVHGLWLGSGKITELLYARGLQVGNGRAEFDTFTPVWFQSRGTAFTWKSAAQERALAVWRDPDGKLFLLHTGSVDELLAFPMRFEGKEPVAGSPQPVLKTGTNLKETYFPLKLNIVDLDGDGKPELLADGNPGKLAVMRGERIGSFREAGCAVTRGGFLAGETLVSPWRIDLDKDGKPDLLLADASGFLTFWPGTADPCVYGSPESMRSDGKVIHVQAGLTGSIQGPSEKRWGYLNVSSGDYDDDGRPEILTCDITGVVRLYRIITAPLELAKPAEFTLHGAPLRAAWRTRPAFLERKFRFANRDAAALLFVDWDGDAAVGLPVQPGGVDLEQTVKLRYRNGNPVRVTGESCDWGRSAVLPVDWDGDGRWDLLVGSPQAATPVIGGSLTTRSTVFFLHNTGTNAEPLFEPPKPLAGADGKLLNFEIHNATPAVTDLNGDGRPDLLVGAEDGKVYYFFHNDLRW